MSDTTLDYSSDEEKRTLKDVIQMVKEKQAKKLQKLKEIDRPELEALIYPQDKIAFLTKDNADKSIISVIYTYSDLRYVKLREFYTKVSNQYKNAEKYKNLIYYHYYFKLNNPLEYHKKFFNKLSDEQRQTVNADGKEEELLKLERYKHDDNVDSLLPLPSIHKDFLHSLNLKNIYTNDQKQPVGIKVQIVKDEHAEFIKYIDEILKYISDRSKRAKLNAETVSKLLKDYKSTKKTYETFLDDINSKYYNLHEFILKMGELSKKPIVKTKEEPTISIEQFLVKMYIDNPQFNAEDIILKSKDFNVKGIKNIKIEKLVKLWNNTNEDTVSKNIDFVIDDYIRQKNGKITESSILNFIIKYVPGLDKSELENIIKKKIQKTDVKIDETEQEREEDEENIDEEMLSDDEEEKEEDYGEEEHEDEEKEEDGVFEKIEEEQPEQFNRKKQIMVKDSEIYGAKITGLLKTIKIENDKIKIRKNEDKKIIQDSPYRTLSQLDNDYQTGIWIDSYKQTWIIPVDETDESKYIISSYTIEYKKKTWYKPTKLWFILQCNSLSHNRFLNKKNELVCFYHDPNGVEQSVSFKVLYEHKDGKFSELSKEILNDEEVWRKSKTKPRELIDYYKNQQIESEDYGARKIATNHLAISLIASSKNMMMEDESSNFAVEIEQRIFNDNQGKTLSQYFMDVAKIVVFLDPTRLGNYAVTFRYNVHSGEIKPSSINGKLTKDFLLPEIFSTDIAGKDEISQVIDRTIFEERTSMLYDLISSVYNINISIASKTLDINNVIACSNMINKLYDDSELLHYVDNGKLYCFSVYEMSDKIKNNDLVNQYTKNPFRPQFINYVVSLVGIQFNHTKEDIASHDFDLLKEIDDILDEIEDTCICGQKNNEKSIKSIVTKPNQNFKEKIFCSVKCMDKYDFKQDEE